MMKNAEMNFFDIYVNEIFCNSFESLAVINHII